jgi:hypothetical protein
MASENDIVIPDPKPAPQPAPAPAPPAPPAPAPAPTPPPAPPAPAPAPSPVDPSPASALTPDGLRSDFSLAVKAIRGLNQFFPAGVRANVERFLAFADIAEKQPWLFEVAVAIINRFTAQGIDPATATDDQINDAVFTVFVQKGEEAKAHAQSQVK